MKKHLFHIVLALGAVLLVGCGGGGGGSTPTVSLSYEGKTEKAALTEENTKYFLGLVNFGLAEEVNTPSYFKSNKIINTQKKNYRLQSKFALSEQEKVLDRQTINGQVSGSVTIVVEETGTYTGTITSTYTNYSDIKGLTFNGKEIVHLTVNDEAIITKNILEYQDFNMEYQDEDMTLNGTVASTSVSTGVKSVQNYTIQNNETTEMVMYENYQVMLNPQGQIVSYNGKVYDSNYGYVEVSTLVPLAYNEDGSRKVEGEVLIEGETSSTTIKYAYDNRVRVEIDSDKDGTIDAVQVYREGNYETEIPNEAPVISITFPQSIYTDTDMSQVKVDVYDPDLDGFKTEYEWSINDESKGNEIALDNTLFKKHDTLKLVVTATDDRLGDVKSSTESKEQVVLNSIPAAAIESNLTTETIEALSQITFDASLSSDKDNDPLTYEWKVYKIIPELEHYDEPIIAIIWPEDTDPNGDIVYPDYIVEVNASRYFDDITLESPIFSANDVGKHIVLCTVFDDDMAEDTSMEINVTIKPLDIIEKSESKVLFPGQETLAEWAYGGNHIRAFDIDDDGDKELVYYTWSADELSNYKLHITFDVKSNTPVTQSYPVNSRTNLINFADFNGDGKTDIYLDNDIMLQNNDGIFEAPFTHNRAIYGTFIEDFNGDGKEDVVVLNQCKLTFTAPYSNYDVPPFLEYMVQDCDRTDINDRDYEQTLHVNDFNSDGIQDFLIYSQSWYDGDAQFIVVYKDVDGNLTQSAVSSFDQHESGNYSTFKELTIGDINNDGFDDIFMGSMLLENNKDFSFKKITTLEHIFNSSSFSTTVIEDINDDRKKDILYDDGGDILSVLVQGNNYLMSDFELKSVIDDMIITDIDHDGKIEIIENYQNRILITTLK